MKESIQKLIDTVESIEIDLNNGVDKRGVLNVTESTISMIQLAKSNHLNLEYEEVLDKLSNRLGNILLKVR
jgi:hypothetical protein